MKNLLIILLFSLSHNSFSQNFNLTKSLNPFFENDPKYDFEKGRLVFQPLSELMAKAEKSFKEKNIEPTKATINDWELVLREIGTVFRKENTFLSCSISDKNYVQLSFVNNYLFSYCENKEGRKPEKKE